jgi:hypothetical protein
MPLENALRDLAQMEDENVAHLVNFIHSSKRGFTRAGKQDTAEEESTLV